jgi:uncharacterized cofD-like protein
VAIGGGSGLSQLLRGLKEYAAPASLESHVPSRGPLVDITAIVTVTDDGGSSGRLRREMGALPPGDVRRCIVALSEDEALLSRLFQYRFENGRGLKGHSFGNLFLTAMTALTGDFAKAVAFSSEVLASRGRIYPSTSENVSLEGWLADGTGVAGETKISRSRLPIRRIALKPRVCQPVPEALDAIADADLICLGPGSLYTSIIPNLLVSGVSEALLRSPGRRAYFSNLMWQPGETVHYKASDHVTAIYRHSAPKLLDWIVVNTTPILGQMRSRYAAEKVYRVENDLPRLRELDLDVVAVPLLERGVEKVRHSSRALAEVAVALAARARRVKARRRASGE